mmetsp:Transcript_599/g.1518  ORF Transcript_599/g.1518 Transcript_599/m.1518 type:complete len:355 (-) Transcript_599:64-1128(-)
MYVPLSLRPPPVSPCPFVPIRELRVERRLDLVVHDEHERAADATEDVGEGTLEEGAGALVGVNLDERVDGAVVELLAARGHHEATANGVEGVGEDARRVGGDLRDDKLGDDGGVLGEERTLAGIVEAEVRAAVHDDALHGDAEALVEGHGAGPLGNLGEAVDEAGELAVLARADVRGEAGTGEVEGVDDEQGAGAREAAGRHVHAEERPELRLGVVRREQVLDGVLEGEVERLGGEVTDDVGRVTAPEGAEALLRGDAGEAVHDAGVAGNLAGHDLGVGVLGLDEELDALDGGGRGLGDGAGDATNREILQERRHGELLLSGSHEVGGDLLGESRGHGAGHGGLDAAGGEGPGH